jgi:hypothetical protein
MYGKYFIPNDCSIQFMCKLIFFPLPCISPVSVHDNHNLSLTNESNNFHPFRMMMRTFTTLDYELLELEISVNVFLQCSIKRYLPNTTTDLYDGNFVFPRV